MLCKQSFFIQSLELWSFNYDTRILRRNLSSATLLRKKWVHDILIDVLIIMNLNNKCNH